MTRHALGILRSYVTWLLGLSGLVSAPGAHAQPVTEDRPVIIASKMFAESYLLSEMFAQMLEAEGLPVDRRFGFGATEIAFQALRNGEIDVYPEYTGTGLLAILGETPSGDADDVYRYVADVFERRWGLLWLPSLGFENSFAVTVRTEDADSLGLVTLSDLEAVAPTMIAGFTPDFLGRSDGLPGLRDRYGLSFRDVRTLLQAVKYEALAAGRVDVIDGYTTDGAIDRYDLTPLVDDVGFFPPYDAAPLVGEDFAARSPRGILALSRLGGRLDEALMQELNRRLEVDGEDPSYLAAVGLVRAGLLPETDTLDAAAGQRRRTGAGPSGADTARARPGDRAGASLMRYLVDRRARIMSLTLRHLFLVVVSMILAMAVAIPLGLQLVRHPAGAEVVIRGVGLLQTVPSIALLAFMIPLLGIGVTPAIAALFLYSLFPILRNTYTGVRDADPLAVASARALGMTGMQVLRYIRLPLAAPVIMAGVRTAAVINVGTTTLAAFIGAGGLGEPIVSGLALSDTQMILSGALPAAVLAFVVDLALGFAEERVTPRGLLVEDSTA